jgi:hypothetical protein
MRYLTLIAALALLTTPATAAAQPAPTPAASAATNAEPAADEPLDVSSDREEVVVTGARSIPVPGSERLITLEQRQRHQAESRCIVAAQGATDPTRPQLDTPEDICLRAQR